MYWTSTEYNKLAYNMIQAQCSPGALRPVVGGAMVPAARGSAPRRSDEDLRARAPARAWELLEGVGACFWDSVWYLNAYVYILYTHIYICIYVYVYTYIERDCGTLSVYTL